MTANTTVISAQPAYKWGAFALFLSIGIILGALGFEYIGGYQPCPMCLQQRYAYYLAIPVLFAALILVAMAKWPIATLLYFLTALVFLANAAFGVFHAGVEWGYWAPPSTCTAGAAHSLGTGGASLLQSLKNVTTADCSEPALRIFGLSLAGWNAVVCIALCIASLKAAFAASEGRSA